MYTQMQGRPTYFIAYDSLTATKGRHGPTDTPLPPDARLVAGTHPPVAQTPDSRYAPHEYEPVPSAAVPAEPAEAPVHVQRVEAVEPVTAPVPVAPSVGRRGSGGGPVGGPVGARVSRAGAP